MASSTRKVKLNNGAEVPIIGEQSAFLRVVAYRPQLPQQPDTYDSLLQELAQPRHGVIRT